MAYSFVAFKGIDNWMDLHPLTGFDRSIKRRAKKKHFRWPKDGKSKNVDWENAPLLAAIIQALI